MVEYTIVKGESSFEIIKVVNEKVQEGWEIVGGVSVIQRVGGYHYFQTMVRSNDEIH